MVGVLRRCFGAVGKYCCCCCCCCGGGGGGGAGRGGADGSEGGSGESGSSSGEIDVEALKTARRAKREADKGKQAAPESKDGAAKTAADAPDFQPSDAAEKGKKGPSALGRVSSSVRSVCAWPRRLTASYPWSFATIGLFIAIWLPSHVRIHAAAGGGTSAETEQPFEARILPFSMARFLATAWLATLAAWAGGLLFLLLCRQDVAASGSGSSKDEKEDDADETKLPPVSSAGRQHRLALALLHSAAIPLWIGMAIQAWDIVGRSTTLAATGAPQGTAIARLPPPPATGPNAAWDMGFGLLLLVPAAAHVLHCCTRCPSVWRPVAEAQALAACRVAEARAAERKRRAAARATPFDDDGDRGYSGFFGGGGSSSPLPTGMPSSEPGFYEEGGPDAIYEEADTGRGLYRYVVWCTRAPSRADPQRAGAVRAVQSVAK